MPTAPARTDGMDDMPRRKIVAARDFRIAGFAAAERFAFAQKLLARGTMDRAVDAAAAEQAFVGRIDDCVDIELGDVAERDLDVAVAQCSRMKNLRSHAAVQPPSTDMLAPVICDAASEHRKTAIAATCSTVTNCFVGCAASSTSLITCSLV